MEQIMINSPEDIGKLIESRTDYLKEMTQKMIDTEVGIIELNISLGCLDEEHLESAHSDTESFKKKDAGKINRVEQKK